MFLACVHVETTSFYEVASCLVSVYATTFVSLAGGTLNLASFALFFRLYRRLGHRSFYRRLFPYVLASNLLDFLQLIAAIFVVILPSLQLQWLEMNHADLQTNLQLHAVSRVIFASHSIGKLG